MKLIAFLLILLALSACNDDSSNENVTPLYLPKEIKILANSSNAPLNKASTISARVYTDSDTDYSNTKTEIRETNSFIMSFLEFPNTFLCIMDEFKVYDQVNKGSYEVTEADVADTDCNIESDDEEETTNEKLIITSSRADNDSPHEIIMSMSYTEIQSETNIDYRFVLHLSIEKGVSENSPYGVFSYDIVFEAVAGDTGKQGKTRLSIDQTDEYIYLSVLSKSTDDWSQGIIQVPFVAGENTLAKVDLSYNDSETGLVKNYNFLELSDGTYTLRTYYDENDNYLDKLRCNNYNQKLNKVYDYYLFDIESGAFVNVPDSEFSLTLPYTHSAENDLNNTGLYDGETYDLRFHQFDSEQEGYLSGLPYQTSISEDKLYLKAGTLLGENNEYVLKPEAIYESVKRLDLAECSHLNIEAANALQLPSLDVLDTDFTLTMDDAPVLP